MEQTRTNGPVIGPLIGLAIGVFALVGCAGSRGETSRHYLDETVVKQWSKDNALEPRHKTVIAWARVHRSAWEPNGSQDAAYQQAELWRRLVNGRREDGYTPRRFHTRTAVNVRTTYTENWEAASGSLSAEDVLTLLVLDEVVRFPATVEELLRQSVLDRADKATEYGGVIYGSGAAVLFMPDVHERGADRAFVAPRAMFEVKEGVLAHYHFHAQAEDNAEYAGPSAGDLEYAVRHNQHCVVFTSVGPGRLDVDVYFPSGVVVDLGEIAEPGR